MDREPRRRKAQHSVAARPAGAKPFIPATTKGKVILAVCLLIVAFLITGALPVARESIKDENYYSNPVRELAADITDAVADSAKAATPDGANAAIDKLRETLTGRSKWANAVIDAEQYWGVDTDYTRFILAMIEVESGGDENVDWQGNVMQIDEGAGDAWDLLVSGVPEAGVSGNTPEASIYAGVMITRDAIGSFMDALGYAPDPLGLNDAALLSQGYNYGHAGWFAYCAQNGITVWTYEASANYQALMGGIGTANHGQKVADALEQLL